MTAYFSFKFTLPYHQVKVKLTFLSLNLFLDLKSFELIFTKGVT